MKVTRWQIVARGLTHRCPNCGQATLFKKGSLFGINPSCPNCGLPIERDEGFFLGSMSLNYGFTTVCFLAPVLWLYFRGTIGSAVAFPLLAFGAIGVPALFYRSSRSWWLMNYYVFLPQHLPANRQETRADEDANV